VFRAGKLHTLKVTPAIREKDIITVE